MLSHSSDDGRTITHRRTLLIQGGKLIAAVLTGWIFRPQPRRRPKSTWAEVQAARDEMNKTIISASEDGDQDWSWALKYAIEIHRETMLQAR